MIFWPYLPVWPFLLGLAAFCAYWNWRAAASFAICIVSVRLLLHFGLNNPLLWRMVLYSVMAFVALFFIDRVAGGFFALVSVSLIAAMLGVLEIRTHLILSESALVIGMIASAFFGPSGGLYSPVSGGRFADSGSLDAKHSQAHNRTHQENL